VLRVLSSNPSNVVVVRGLVVEVFLLEEESCEDDDNWNSPTTAVVCGGTMVG
jgi:hypothetical protein